MDRRGWCIRSALFAHLKDLMHLHQQAGGLATAHKAAATYDGYTGQRGASSLKTVDPVIPRRFLTRLFFLASLALRNSLQKLRIAPLSVPGALPMPL